MTEEYARLLRSSYLKSSQVGLPKFKASLDRLLNRKAYDFILSAHSVDSDNLSQFVERAVSEGNAVLIQREYHGHMVVVWKD